MRVRGLLSIAALVLLAAGCGGGSVTPKSAGVHLNGKRAQGNYVFETAASGTRFLLPASLLAVQGNRAVDVVAPALPNATHGAVTIGGPGYRYGVASATAVVPHSAHVEVLATGDPGRRFALSWEETCGWTQHGQAAEGGTGAQGSATLRSPAVTLVRLPRISGGVPSCYLAATASAASFTHRLHLAIIDY